jgi:hypothetical protein
VGGQVQFMFDGLATSLPFIKAGRLRAFAVSSPERAPALPDVPTLAEWSAQLEALAPMTLRRPERVLGGLAERRALGPIGPVAIVVPTVATHEQALIFAALAEADRPIRVFRELHLARQWLDAQPEPKPNG